MNNTERNKTVREGKHTQSSPMEEFNLRGKNQQLNSKNRKTINTKKIVLNQITNQMLKKFSKETSIKS